MIIIKTNTLIEGGKGVDLKVYVEKTEYVVVARGGSKV